MKIGILEPSDFSADALVSLKKSGTVQLFDGTDIEDFVRNKEVLFVRLNISIDADLLSKAKKLKYICSPTTGLNHIDTDFCKAHDIKIISLKGETKFLRTIRATPEHTLGLLIALKRNYHTAFLNRNNDVWNREPHKGYEIYGSRIGIIGLGRVGNIVSKYLKAMGAEVAYYDIKDRKKDTKLKSFRTMEALIKWSDSILLCANYDAEKGVIIDSEKIDLMKDKYFINTARAELTDETYLIKCVSNGHFKGVAIDVITDEQSSRKNLDKFLKSAESNNVIITPHIGGATYTSMCRTEEFIVEKLLKHKD